MKAFSKFRPADDWVLVPQTPAQIEDAARWCRRLVTRRALMAAGVAMVPVPGIDWVTDVGVLLKLIPDINHAFGLTPQQVERLTPERRVAVFQVISSGSSVVVGRLVTRELLMTMLRAVGVRLTTKQAAKYVPIAGSAVSAALTFSALKLVCDQHIQQCVAVCSRLALPAPARAAGPARPA